MSNELVEKYLGKTCLVSTGAFGSALKGEITVVKDNWIEITDKKGTKLLNLDYVTHISPIEEK